STHARPSLAATAATWRVWFDWTPPIETSVSQPCASASAARYSSFLTLFPPYARPELQSSRFAQISTRPPRCSSSRGSRCTGDGPNSNGTRSKSARATGGSLLPCRRGSGRGGAARDRAPRAVGLVERAGHLVVRHRTREEVSLRAVAAELAHRGALAFGLDALGDGDDAERMRE